MPLPDAPVASYGPTVAQMWHGTSDDRQVTGHINRLDADFHNGIPGTSLADGTGPFGPAALSIRAGPGVHRLLGRADCNDPRGSTNTGVLTVPFVIR